MKPAKAFAEWAKNWVNYAKAKGAEIDLFVLPADAERMLFNAALGERLTKEEYRDEKDGSYLAGVRVLWTTKLPHGQSWIRYRGGKTVKLLPPTPKTDEADGPITKRIA